MFNLAKIFVCQILLLFAICLMGACKKEEDPITLSNETGTVTDRQGNVYATVKIGEQWWMAENLKVTVFNDSSSIAEVNSSENDSVWAKMNEAAFCLLDARYGLHYNWFAITHPKKIAPIGWHIPTDEDWKALELQLGMSQSEINNTSWRGENISEKFIPESSKGWPSNSLVFGTNESGFSALPGGCRLFNGVKGEVAATGFWWTVSSQNTSNAWYRNISSNETKIFRYYADKNYGLTVRCIKD